jgi:hypothetical protein
MSTPTIEIIETRPACEVCGHRSHWLGDHLMEAHGLSVSDYLEAHPKAPTASQEALDKLASSLKGQRRSAAPLPEALTTTVMGYTQKVDVGVGSDLCLPMPRHWKWASKGVAAEAIKDAFLDILGDDETDVWVWGMPGTSKDSSIKALCASFRIPSVIVQIKPGQDLAPLFFVRALKDGNTFYEYGHVWKCITEGVVGTDGERRPVLVLISDFDRADPAQIEWFRMILEEGGRINGPDGKVFNLFPGTRFVATANTNGSGDERGRMVSAGVIDSSIMDRFNSAVEYKYMHWDDESSILRAKFPLVTEQNTEFLNQVGGATAALRKAIDRDTLYAEFSHRALCSVMGRAERILKVEGRWGAKSNRRAWRAWLCKLDRDNADAAKAIIDSHMSGGALDEENR